MSKKRLLLLIISLLIVGACKSSKDGYTAVKPKYHHSWYKNHTNKKNWHVGRIKLRFEKQGVKKVTMKR